MLNWVKIMTFKPFVFFLLRLPNIFQRLWIYIELYHGKLEEFCTI